MLAFRGETGKIEKHPEWTPQLENPIDNFQIERNILRFESIIPLEPKFLKQISASK